MESSDMLAVMSFGSKQIRAVVLAVSCTALLSCSAPATLYSTDAPTPQDRIAIGFASVEVRDVSLPTYAASDVIAIEGPDGVLLNDETLRWADEPERAVALELTRQLVQLSGARIASEPWPFEEFPDAELSLRFETFLPRANGQFEAKGQYFVSTYDGTGDASGLFDLSVPYDLARGPAAIAEARGVLVLELAELIAREGL